MKMVQQSDGTDAKTPFEGQLPAFFFPAMDHSGKPLVVTNQQAGHRLCLG